MLCKPGHSCWIYCSSKHSLPTLVPQEVLGPNFCTESTPKFCCEHWEHHLHIQKRAGCSCSSQFRFLHLVCWWSLNMAKWNPSLSRILVLKNQWPKNWQFDNDYRWFNWHSKQKPVHEPTKLKKKHPGLVGSWAGDHPQEDLVKFGILGTLQHLVTC